MAARTSSTRPGPSTARTTTPQTTRLVISFDSWDAKLSLDESQLQSVDDLRKRLEQKPLPSKFVTEEIDQISRPSTPINAAKRIFSGIARSPSRPATPSPTATPTPQTIRPRHSLHPTAPITTPQQFHDWFGLIEQSIQHAQESHFRAHISQLSTHLNKFDHLVDEVNDMDSELRTMLDAWTGVEEGGKSLKGASEKLLEEKDQLIALTDEIQARLEYFQELERATRMLNHPGEDLVLQPDFLLMVERVDVCLEFLQTHRDYREADIYILRFQQCLTRAMSLIKIYFINSLNILSADIHRKLSEKDASSVALNHMLYSRFITLSQSVSPLLSEMERRSHIYPDEVNSLLAECHMSYLGTRKTLLVGRIQEEIKGLNPAHSDLVELTRAGCGYLKNLCADEFKLYRHFFSSGEDRFYRYLETLCDYLYDDLRPRILHEQRITILCEVCTVLQALTVIGGEISASTPSTSVSGLSSDDETDSQDLVTATGSQDDLETTHPGNAISAGLAKLNIAQLLKMILQDAQTRLIFKAQSVVQNEIRYYTPDAEELDYPAILNGSGRTSNADLVEPSLYDVFYKVPSIEGQKKWYPSLPKTVWLLHQLHRFVQPEVFFDIAHEGIAYCRESLSNASQILLNKQDVDSLLDSELFLIRHLLVLKEMTTGLDAVQNNRTSVAAAPSSIDPVAALLRGASLLNATSFLGGFAGVAMPRQVEATVDARADVDQALKAACEAFIHSCVKSATEPIRSFVEKSSAYLDTFSAAASRDKQPLLSAHEFATPEKALESNTEFKSCCEHQVKRCASRLKMYVEEERTITVLWTPVHNQIVEEYALFRGLLGGKFGGEILKDAYTESQLISLLRAWFSAS